MFLSKQVVVNLVKGGGVGGEERSVSWVNKTVCAKALSTAMNKALCLVLVVYRDEPSLVSTLKLSVIYMGDRPKKIQTQ